MTAKTSKVFCLIFTILLFGIIPNNKIYPQNAPVSFESLSLQNGVSLNLTYCMLQDSRGFIWFGTMYGLVRYDGKNYITYRSNALDSTSISFDDITSLFEDSKGNIWVGTWGGGLNRFNTATQSFTRFLYKPGDKSGLSDNIIWTITEDNNGFIWIGTDKGGIDKYNPQNNSFKNYSASLNSDKSVPSNNIKKIFKDKDGTIWVGTKMGLAKYQPDSDNFNSYLIYKIKDSSVNLVQTIYEDRENNLWIGTWNGLFNFNRKDEEFKKFEYEPGIKNVQNIVFAILEDYQKNIWLGTTTGLYKLNLDNPASSEVFRHEYGNPNSLMGNNINNLMEDKSGTLWINCYRNGINKLINRKKNFNYYTYDPNNNNTLGGYYIYSLEEDKNGNIWIGTANNILNKFNTHDNSISRFTLKFPDQNKRGRFSLPNLAMSGDNLWIGTTQGVMLFDTKAEKVLSLPKVLTSNKDIADGNITSILVTKEGLLLVGVYEEGLYVYDINKNKLDHIIYPTSQLVNYMRNTKLTLYQDREGNIWAGTFAGLEKIDLDSGKIENFFHILYDPNSLSNDYVYSMYEDGNGNFWIATSNGLNLFNQKTKTFKNFFEKDGLPNNVIMALQGDNDGNIWISTYKGISRFDVKNMTFKNFDIDDGLQSNIFFADCALFSKSGLMFFGGNNGLNSFDPNKIEINNFIPPVYITKFKVGKDIGDLKEIKISNPNIEFPYDRNFFELNFAALDYSNPEKNAYKYKLDGVDKDWVYAGNNANAVYTDLSPGSYTFRVKGSNSDGVWNEKAAVVSFVITPPFWRSWWFITISILLSLAIIYAVHLIWVRNKVRHALEIEKVREEESEKVRKQTSLDFHDELGHRLTRISLLTEIAKRKLENDHNVLPLLRKISENSIQLYEGTKDFIWAIDPQNDSIYELLVRLKDFGDEMFSDSNIDFLVKGMDSELEKTELSTDMKRHLTLIFKEAMHNALKHSKSKKVMLESRIIGDELEIILEDDGAGFDNKIESEGHGLKNMAKRAEKLKGNFLIISEPGKGTKLSFRGKIKEKI